MSEAPTVFSNDRILLVDDNLTNLQVLFGALEEEGYELLVAQSGEEALQVARQAHPQLILLDINMPGMDGYETCRLLKGDASTRESVVVFLSARGAVGDKVRGLQLGAVDYIEKPFQFEEVLARIRQHLTTYHQHRQLVYENRQLKSLVEGGFRELESSEVTALIAEGESDRVEFKSTLRWNLHNNKPDKRLENACLKTVAAFLNRAGGFLLIGVDDDGHPLGLDADDFASEDKLLLHWNGLIKEHLGVQVSPRIRSTILDAKEKRVLVVQTLPANEPVFFRRDNDESFFVRTGNGTHALKPSEVLKYIEGRELPAAAGNSVPTEPADRMGQYTLGELIGSGGMGSVYQARHAMLHRPAAIKLLPAVQANQETIERFQREVQLTSQLTHPNTITLYDYGRKSDGSFYYVMELIDGMTLSQLVAKTGPIPAGRVIHLCKQICGSLAEAHEKGLVHRDIKPANIMVSYRGGLGDFVTVLDFGLIKTVLTSGEPQLTAAGAFFGSPGFVSPETVNGDPVDSRSDLYSFGATAWFLLTGREVFVADTSLNACLRHVNEVPDRPSKILGAAVDTALEDLIMSCLEKQPRNRPASARHLLKALGKCPSASDWSDQMAADWWKQQVRLALPSASLDPGESDDPTFVIS